MAVSERTPASTHQQERLDSMKELLRENLGIEPVHVVCRGLMAANRTRQELRSKGFQWDIRYRADELDSGRAGEQGRIRTFEDDVINVAEVAEQVTLIDIVQTDVALESRECWSVPANDDQSRID